MAAAVGRAATLTFGGAALTGVREKGLSANGESIDVTSGEDAGERLLLAVTSQDDVDVSVSGIDKDAVLRDHWFAGTRTQPTVLTFADGATLSGSARMSNYNEGMPFNDAITFETVLQFTGPKTYTPAA